MVLSIATIYENAQTPWEPVLTATERDCLLLGRLVERTHLVLKEAQTSTNAARDDTAKLLRAIRDLSKAVRVCTQYVEALNCRGRLDMLLASASVSMDLQDRILDLTEAVDALNACKPKCAADVQEHFEFVGAQLQKARIMGDSGIEQMLHSLLREVTLRHMHCGDTKLLNKLLDQLAGLLTGSEDQPALVVAEAETLRACAAAEMDPVQAFFMVQVAEVLGERYQRKAKEKNRPSAVQLPRLRVPVRSSQTGSPPQEQPLQHAISAWVMLPPDLFSSPRTSSEGASAQPGSPLQWWGDRRSSRSLLTLGEQAAVHTQERLMRIPSTAVLEKVLSGGVRESAGILTPTIMSPPRTPRLHSSHSMGAFFVSSTSAVPDTVFDDSITLEQLGETWPDDVTVLAKVLDQKDPVTRHVAATVLALGADHDPAVREQLCQAGVINTLVGMLGAWEEALAADAAQLLRFLAREAPARAEMRESGAVPALLLLIQRGTDATVEAATRCLANVICDSEMSSAAAATAGAVAMLVAMLRCGRDCLEQVAAAALANMLKGSPHRQSLAIQAGALKALVTLLHSGSITSQTVAARALAPLVLSDSNKRDVVRDGVVPLLTKMLDNALDGVQVGGAVAIAGLAANSEEIQAEIGRTGCIQRLVSLLEDGSAAAVQAAADALASLAGWTENQGSIIAAGALPTLLLRMTDGSPGMRSAAARCLRNVTASASKEIKSVVAHNGGAKACIDLLSEDTPSKLSELALNILWNLAFRSEANRNQLGRLGVVPPLVGILMRGSSTGALRQQAARLLASVISQHQENHHEAVSKGAIVPLVAMLSGSDADKAAAAHALSILAAQEGSHEAMAAAQTLPALLAALHQTQDAEAGDAIVRALGNRVCSQTCLPERTVTGACQQASPRLQAMLASPSASSRQAAVVAAGNLACHGQETQKSLMEAGVLPELVGLLAASFSTAERLEAAHALSSITAGNAEVAHAVVDLQPLPHLVALLTLPDLSAQTAAAMCLAELSEQCHMQEEIADSGILPKLVQLVQEGGADGQEAAARILCTLVTDPSLKEEMLSLDCAPAVLTLLEVGSAHGHGLAVDLLQSLDDDSFTIPLPYSSPSPSTDFLSGEVSRC
ncbi:hypothetical protein WJX73_007524 [Symbiochloris irregularis]|uniref:Vacuolar protein 8 n=1 Tax=Symbiochloris irregularis TaxID=706552 RepID=A0AAW1NW10_9CHLO